MVDGRTCEEPPRIGGAGSEDADRPGHGTQWAIGDGDVPRMTAELLGLHRLTAPGDDGPGDLCDFAGGLPAEICEVGTNPVHDGAAVRFLETGTVDHPVEEATLVCEAVTGELLPGEREIVACMGELGGEGNVHIDVGPGTGSRTATRPTALRAAVFDLCPG